MSLNYYDFEIHLKWSDNERVSVFYKRWGLSAENPNPYKDPLNPENPDPIHITDLCTAGRKISEFLFPTKELRDKFRTLWWDKGAIRLRLCYPDDKDSIKALSAILWEYSYLSKQSEEEECGRAYLLGLRDDISIVHCVPSMDRASFPVSVNSLPVRMKFFSYFGQHSGDPTEDNKILKKFIERYSDLTPIIQCSTIHDPKTPDIKNNPQVQPKTADVMQSILTEHLIHLSGHCETDKITLGGEEEDNVITIRELETQFEVSEGIDLKAVILPCCNSADGDSITTALHKHGVPVVIGMSRTIDPSQMSDFADGFYQALATWSGDSLEKAVVKVRNSIFKEDDLAEHWYAGYGLPRLFLNGSDSILIPENLLFGSDAMVRGFDNFIRRESRNKNRHPKTNEWQTALAAWAEGPQARHWFLMTGPAGSGKSIQIAWLLDKLKNQNEKIIYHFCQAEAERTITPLDFIRESIVPQLVKLYAAYKENITPGRFPLRVGNEDDALWTFVIEPLCRLKEKGVIDHFPVIIIDSIDVTPRSNPENSILGLLLRHRGDLDKVARFLVTANSDLDTETGSTIIEDIRRLTYHYQEVEADLTIEKLDDSLILFSKLKRRLAPLISEGPSYPGKIKKWNDLYQLLDVAVEAARQKYGELAIQLLTVVTVAYEPLSDNHIAKLIGFRSNPDEIEQFKQLLRGLQPFFKNYQDYGHKLILYHNSLKTYLLHKIKREREHSLADTHELFVVAIRPESGDWAKITNWNTLTGANWQEWPDGRTAKPEAGIARYVRRYLGDHAYYGYYYTSWESFRKRRDRAKDFLNLICDSKFRSARLDEMGRQAALQDIWLGLRVINAEYIHDTSPGKSDKKARVAFDRLLAANEPGSDCRNELVKLEQQLRNDSNTGWEDLFVFLDLDTAWWEA